MSQHPRAARTRRTILSAAAVALSRDSGATLADVADEAGVARATLNRYFPQRDDLLRGLAEDAIDRISTTVEASRPDDGPVPAVLGRVAEALLPLAAELRFLETGAAVFALPGMVDRWYSSAAAVEAVVIRGQAEGTIKADVAATWVTDLFLGAVWTASDAVHDGRLARLDAPRLVVSSIVDGVGT